MMLPISLLIFVVYAVSATNSGDSCQKFAGELYKNIRSINQYQGVLVNPISIQTILSLTEYGAKGTTAEEIKKSILLPNTSKEVVEISTYIQAESINRIYSDPNLSPFQEEFRTTATEIYKSIPESTTFATTYGTADRISSSAKFSYQAKNFHKLTKNVLINSFSMKTKWLHPFDDRKTESQIFAMSSSSQSYPHMMTEGPFEYNYFESEEFDAIFLEIPLEDNTTLTVVFPNDMSGFSYIESNIDFALTTPQYIKKYVVLTFPRTDQSESLELTSYLENMGMGKSFTEEADFSGITGVPGDIAIHKVFSSSTIKINEEGIEVNSETLVSTKGSTTKIKYIVLNRPFLIHLKKNGTTVLVGKIDNP